MKSLEFRMFKLEGKQSFPDYRSPNDEENIYSLIGFFKVAGLYSGELPPEPPERRVLLEILRDKETGKHIKEWMREWFGDYSPSKEETKEEEEKGFREWLPFFVCCFSKNLTVSGQCQRENWLVKNNIVLRGLENNESN